MSTHHSSKASFFRQSTWLVAATMVSGVFMMAVHSVVTGRMETTEWNVFAVLLRFFLLLGIPAAGLQIVFAHQAAAVVTSREEKELAGAAKSVIAGTLVWWLIMAAVILGFQDRIVARLKISNPAALWATMLLGLLSLWAPVLRGLLQGQQNFSGLGNMLILDGVGRFMAIVVIVFLGGQAAGGMTGALLGQCAAFGLGLWLTRKIWMGASEQFNWRRWLAKVVPLTLGSGTVIYMSNADVVFVQANFSKDQTSLYMPAAMIGTALVTFTTPLAAVMFPKIVQSLARTERSNAFQLAIASTALLGAGAALACTLLPELPLRIMFFRDPSRWAAAPLVPWFAWCFLPLILANILIGNLLARSQFGVVGAMLLVPFGFTLTLYLLRHHLHSLELISAFKSVIRTLGLFNLALLGIAYWFTLRHLKNAAAEAARSYEPART